MLLTTMVSHKDLKSVADRNRREGIVRERSFERIYEMGWNPLEPKATDPFICMYNECEKPITGICKQMIFEGHHRTISVGLPEPETGNKVVVRYHLKCWPKNIEKDFEKYDAKLPGCKPSYGIPE